MNKSRKNWVIKVFNLVKVDILQFLRQRVVFVSSLLTPVSMILAFGLGMKNQITERGISYFDTIVPGILAISVMFAATNSMGYGTIMDRQKRTVEDMIMNKSVFGAFIVSKYVAMILKALIQLLIILTIAMVFFGFRIDSLLMITFTFINITVFFSALGVVLALFNNEMSFSSVSNFILMPLFYFGGIFFPLENFGSIAKVLVYIPLSIYVILFDYACLGTSEYAILPLNIIVCVYSVISVIIATLLFKYKIKKG